MAQERANTTEEINKAVRRHLSPSKPVKIGGLEGHDRVLAGLSGEGRVSMSGRAGAFLAAFLDGPDVTLTGSAGDHAGSTMAAGRLVVEGTVGRGFCCHMAGGRARVKGRVGALAGAMMSGGLVVLDAPLGKGPGEGMSGGTLVLLRPNQLPSRPPSPPARLIAPRGTSKDVKGYSELEMDHEEVTRLAGELEALGVTSPERVADLLVVLVATEEERLPSAPSVPPEVPSGGSVVLEVHRGEAPGGGAASDVDDADEDRGGGDVSTRFKDFARQVREREG